jgi:parvulin-like peptidyl-prolyl isomerase
MTHGWASRRRDIMPAWIVQFIGMGLGCLLTFVVVSILIAKKTLAAGEVAALMVAFGFFVASGFDWRILKITNEGIEVQRDVAETAAAVSVLAEQVQQSDDAIRVINEQLAQLTLQLSRTNAVTPGTTQSIQQALRALPAIDRTKLNDTRDRMLMIEQRLRKAPGR